MQLLKGITGTALLVVLVFTATVYTACKDKYVASPNACTGIVCQNNGICLDGKCDCTSGYTGEFCQDKAIAPYIGKWRVTQEVVSRNGQPVSGMTTTYETTITEDPSGVTILNFSDFMGQPDFDNVLARIGVIVDSQYTYNGYYIGIEIPADPGNFVFKTYQPLGQSHKQLLRGEGAINSIGTQLTGEFYIVYADSSKAIEDRITFSATYQD